MVIEISRDRVHSKDVRTFATWQVWFMKFPDPFSTRCLHCLDRHAGRFIPDFSIFESGNIPYAEEGNILAVWVISIGRY